MVVIIWATTPLAVKWSGEGLSPMTAVAMRMLLAAVLGLVLLKAIRLRLRWDRTALVSYLTANLGVAGAMSLVYWSALFVPSGMISVLFGLSPLISALFAQRLLQEPKFSKVRWVAVMLGFGGLVIIFSKELALADDSAFGVMLLIVAVTLFSLSGVLVKRVDAALHPLTQTVGTLVMSAPFYLAGWWLFGDANAYQPDARAYAAVLYLALGGSLLGFLCYFHILRHLPATTVALVTLMTPVLALLLGAVLNGEEVPLSTILGAGCILGGLSVYLWGERWAELVFGNA
ncbi:MAG: EamA family transporter [Gammaproteobacteria bacterium]